MSRRPVHAEGQRQQQRDGRGWAQAGQDADNCAEQAANKAPQHIGRLQRDRIRAKVRRGFPCQNPNQPMGSCTLEQNRKDNIEGGRRSNAVNTAATSVRLKTKATRKKVKSAKLRRNPRTPITATQAAKMSQVISARLCRPDSCAFCGLGFSAVLMISASASRSSTGHTRSERSRDPDRQGCSNSRSGLGSR